MARSGVSEEVIKAFIQSASATFSLAPEDIIRLQDLGVSASLTTAMLNHDTALRDNPRGNVAPPVAPPGQPPVVSAPLTPNDGEVYGNLSPYGYWNEVPDYGWCWQPYSWLAYDYYPWGWLGCGYWGNIPGRGRCWFPHSHFAGFNPLHPWNRSSFAVNRFAGSRVTTFQNRTRTFTPSVAPRSVMSVNHANVGVRSSPSASSFSGGFHGSVSSGVHGSVSTGFHGSVGGGFHGGGGGGFHAGGGGGFHGGGGGGSHGGGGGGHR